jgi:pyridoxine/pyridoxamine 5'-phosphate oxidase
VRASRPPFGSDADELLSWESALELLAGARNAWLATVRVDGRPHAAPVWVVVADAAPWFWTERTSIKGKNLAANPAASLHAEDGDAVAIFEGVAHNADPSESVVEEYTRTYDAATLDRSAFWHVDVRSAIAWHGHLGSVQRRATRFTR